MFKKVKNIFISTFTFIAQGKRSANSGPIVPLLNFFKNKVEKLYILEQPLPMSDFLDIQFSFFEKGKLQKIYKKNFFFSNISQKAQKKIKTYFRLKLRDIRANLYFFIKNYKKIKKNKFDLFIGLECVNAICGIIFKKIGLVDTVVYYIFDWTPYRYKNSLTNKLYLFLDKIATYYADYTWNITYKIEEAKINILRWNSKKMSPQLYVPYSVDYDPKMVLPDSKIDTNLIIYCGGLIKNNGIFVLLDAFQKVIKNFPKAKLLFIGGYNEEKNLKRKIIQYRLTNNARVTGYLTDKNEILKLQSQGALGVAPYLNTEEGSNKAFGDVMKIRTYFVSGLVVITTNVPPVAKEIQEEKLGYVTQNDSAEEIAEAISFFLKNKELLFKYRKNVISKAKQSNWEKNYRSTLEKMHIKI